MQPELYENNIRKWLEANGTTVSHITNRNRFSSFIDLNSLKVAIEELIAYRTAPEPGLQEALDAYQEASNEIHWTPAIEERQHGE